MASDLFVLFKLILIRIHALLIIKIFFVKMGVKGSFWMFCLWSQVNLDFHTKNAIAQSLHKPTATSFLVAQRKIYNLMENNSYPRFINSDLYNELYAAAAREDMDVES